MFLATAASVGHRTPLPEFVGHYFTGTASTGTAATVDPSSVISGLKQGDVLIVCSTVSDSGLSSSYLPDVPTSSAGGPTWNHVVSYYSSDTNDSTVRVNYAIHNGNSYTISLSSSYAVQIHQLLAFRGVSSVSVLDVGSSSNTSHVNFPTITGGVDYSRDGVLQFGGGGQYRANLIGSYPDPGVYDYFYNYLVYGGTFASGLVGFGFYNPGTITGSRINAVGWDGSAYNHSYSSTFDITLKLQT